MSSCDSEGRRLEKNLDLPNKFKSYCATSINLLKGFVDRQISAGRPSLKDSMLLRRMRTTVADSIFNVNEGRRR